MNSLHEECGVLGIFANKPYKISQTCYYGLYALQHRGQESCGLIVCNDGLFYSQKDLGLVGDVLSKNVIDGFPDANMAVGHVRYGTTGGTNRANCQPVQVNHHKGRLALAHNGNISNAFALRNKLEENGAIFHTTSDTETIAYIITQARLKSSSIEEAVSLAMNELEGAYSLVIMSATKLIAVRDPRGFRPLCYGMTGDGTYIIASESCALDSVGAEFVRDIEPGEILVFDHNGTRSITEHCNKKAKTTCIFEYIYFARPDSVIDGISVHQARINAGRILAEYFPANADIVIGVPDSGLDAALGYSRESGIPYGIGLIKNKYIGRTFISPGQESRVDQVHIKLNGVKDQINGKRIVLVDDSIVRGTTCRLLVDLLREAGAAEIHMRVSAPPFTNPCYYGTDIDSKDNLIACSHSIDEIAKIIGVDSLGYLPIAELKTLTGNTEYCHACFTGSYPTAIPESTSKSRFEMPLSKIKSNQEEKRK